MLKGQSSTFFLLAAHLWLLKLARMGIQTTVKHVFRMRNPLPHLFAHLHHTDSEDARKYDIFDISDPHPESRHDPWKAFLAI